MGEIRKDNLHESLIEELNELANIDLSGKQDKTDESLLTESKDVIGAINELFQSANNGKELIANAIGEPLSSDDTFSAMSNDINGLLATFKTNMMNNGITVESGDKFKQLIDKIATMVEEGSGKGIQYEEKVLDDINYSTRSGSTETITITTNIKPTIVFVAIPEGKFTIENSNFTLPIFSNFRSSSASFQWMGYSAGITCSIDNVQNNSFNINFETRVATGSFSIKGVTYYAIGVGEEDTTLRDSLASILTEEGVNVTEEDDMASLISKTDNQFNSFNTTITLLNNQVNSLTSELAGKVTPAGDAVASNVLTGKTFINSTGNTLTGTMANNGTKTITPKASAQTLGAGYYDKITINGDADLVAANIVSGKNIFGVTGSATASKTMTLTGTNTKNFKYRRFNTSSNVSSDVNGNMHYFTISLDFEPSTIVIIGTYDKYRYITTYIKNEQFLSRIMISLDYGITQTGEAIYANELVVRGNNVFDIPVSGTPATATYVCYIS